MDGFFKASKRIAVPKTRRHLLHHQCPAHASNNSHLHHHEKSITSSSSTPASRSSSSSSSHEESTDNHDGSQRQVGDSSAGRLVQDLRGGE